MKLIKLFVLSILLGSLIIPVRPALAAECYGSDCHGQDPVDMGCSGWTVMRLLDEGSSGAMWTELRYSDGTSCYSNWTKVSNYNNNVRRLWARLTQNNDPDYTVAQQEEQNIYSYIWTNMETAANEWCAKGDQGYSYQAFDTHSAYTCG
jgi:hypothetical protein